MLLQLFGVFLILITFLPLLKSPVWWIRGFEFPLIQITFLTVITIVFYTISMSWDILHLVYLGVFMGTLIFQLNKILPYTPFFKKQVVKVKRDNQLVSIKALSANIYMYNNEFVLLKKEVEQNNPDVILLLECNNRWMGEMAYLKSTYQHTIELPQEDTYGMLFYSKFEILSQEIHYLVEDDVPSIHLTLKLGNNKEVVVHCLHPKPPSPTENEESTERDVELYLVAKTIKPENPTIVMGDLNDVAWSRVTNNFRKISGLLDPRIGRGFFNTFHAKYAFMRWPLDHFFHSNHFELIDIQRLLSVNSDHFPMYINLQLKNDDKKEKVITTDLGIEKEVDNIIEEELGNNQPDISIHE